ncbi:hypothetical protein CC80DRAFT_548893 [Byssothecium circinans]|uniref:Peptidase S54 rhomboid domain-containing protein n=1 Tax=Byssothecium circinans TaxID=147558 RepID=A0A6A5TU41_9PLEO|nr:hypothetical protein CC80DRAFT_548893 [Byssothecium circinans]
MSLLRCSTPLLRLYPSHLRLSSAAHWRPTYCAVHHANQARDKHHQPLRRQSSPTPKQPQYRPGQPDSTSVREENAVPHKVYFSPGDENYQHAEEEATFKLPKVRQLRPAIFALALSSAFYAYFSYRQAKEELKPQSWNIPNPLDQWRPQRRTAPTPTEVVTNVWNQLDPMSKLTWGIIGTNAVVHLSSFALPGLWERLWHTPARNVSSTLFTSAFVHSGAMHFGFNMFACYNFLPIAGYSPLFQANTNHMLSFYLSTALLSGYAQHLASCIFTKTRAVPSILIPSGGASGALFAIFGVFCMEYPTHQVGIVFLPFGFDAQYFLPAVMLFDFVGMVRGFKFVSFGHAAHLSGATIGAAYSFFDGHKTVWRPAVDFWKRRLQNRA